ncbi:MAG TPA: HAMP domain-containing histidine kinase [Candidatus Merdivicinus intestinigallinarum]|nr:HAMP domain-containing histidine kinase [Candidatus Merdivicinus intestinigallinarum]
MLILTIILGLLAAAFAALWLLSRKNLKSAVEELRRIRSGQTGRRLRLSSPDRLMERLIAEVNHLLDDQQKAEQAHAQAEKERRDEIANISHDLRTPLTSILGYLQLLQQDSCTPAERQEYLQISENRAKSLQSLLSGFYDLSRLEAGGYALELEPLDPAGILYQMAADYYADFLDAGMEPKLLIPETLPLIYADKQGITRVFQNLTQNALKHGGDYLAISSREEPDYLAVCFSNPAPELTKEDCARIFDRFFTADRMRTGQNTGLGLAIVKALCQKMGGQVSASLENGVLTLETRWKRSKFAGKRR